MKKNDLITMLNDFTKETSTVAIELAHKSSKNIYKFMDIMLVQNIQNEVLELLKKSLLEIIKYNELEEFNPIGKRDGTNETMLVDDIDGFKKINEFKESRDNYVGSLKELGDTNFYIVTIESGKDFIKVFRKYSKSKSLAKGVLFSINDNKLDKIKNNIFQIDSNIDFISVNDEVLVIFNRYPFEVITNYKDNYIENLNKAMNEIEESKLIENMDKFKEDCKNSMRIAKQFTKAMQCSSINLITTHIDEISFAIREAELPIEFVDKKFKYENKEQLSILVALLSDKYAKTLIGKRITESM